MVEFKEVRVVELPVEKVRNVAVGAKGVLFVLCEEQLCILEKDGKLRKSVKLPVAGRGLAVFKEQVFVGLGDKLGVFDLDLKFVESWHSLGEKAAIMNVAVDERDLFVTDFGQKMVWRFDHDGGLVGQFDGKQGAREKWGFLVPSPYFDLGFDGKGQLWVVNPGMHRVELRSREGKFLRSWGKFSMADVGFCGCCNPSFVLPLADGLFVTSEKGIPRVKVLNGKGDLLQVVAGAKDFDRGTAGLDLALGVDGEFLVLDPVRGKICFFDRINRIFLSTDYADYTDFYRDGIFKRLFFDRRANLKMRGWFGEKLAVLLKF